jgi:hypothetical protein
MARYKHKQGDIAKNKAFQLIAKRALESRGYKCWVCEVIDMKCTMKTKTATSPETVCVCPDCYKAVNKMMFDESDFLMRLHDLKRLMYKNGNNRLLTYSQMKDWKEEYLTEQIALYKKTQDKSLQHDLIKKVLSLPV